MRGGLRLPGIPRAARAQVLPPPGGAKLRPGADAELTVDAGEIRLDRLRAHEQLRGDLPVRQPGGGEVSNELFRFGQVAARSPPGGAVKLGARALRPQGWRRRTRRSQRFAQAARRLIASFCRGARSRRRPGACARVPAAARAARRGASRWRPPPRRRRGHRGLLAAARGSGPPGRAPTLAAARSEEHTSELQSHHDLVCRLLLEKKKKKKKKNIKIKKKKKI